jgi:autotransporter strand-loop-strand O-heptosyltransferase
MKRIKLLYLTPHLSTGGMPQFALKRIQKLNEYRDEIEIFVVEYSKFSDTYVVQRNSILEMIDSDHFFTLGDTSDTRRKYEIIQIIKDNDIDLVHSEEMLEGFESFNKIPTDLINMLYSDDRSWRMIETCHNIWFDPKESKKLKPDAYSLISPYHKKKTFASESSYNELHLYPYENKVDIKRKNRKSSIKKLGFDENKKNVLNVGLWTSGKNQGEGIEIARFIESSSPDVFFHFVGNLAPNFENYWGDITKNLPSNVKIWGERDDVDDFMIACDAMMFNSTWECNPLVIREAIGYGMKILARNLPQYYDMYDEYITPIEGDIKKISGQLIAMLESDIEYSVPDDSNFGKSLLDFYRKVMEIEIVPQPKIDNDYEFIQHFVGQPYFELRGSSSNKFKVEFSDNGKIVHSDVLNFNSWSRLNRKYYTNWDTTVYENDKIIYKNSLDLKGKRVYISFGSKSLGDTLAWIPYMEEFRKIHNCELIVSTFINHLFVEQYPDITFINPGETVNNLYAQYNIGWYYDDSGDVDYSRVPNDFRKQPLQKTATDILGLEYNEIRPKLNLPNVEKKKKVGIGFHSTAQSKYWNNSGGWQDVVDYLNSLGYECMIYSREGDGYMNNYYPEGVTIFKGGNLQEVINDLCECEFFVGLGSGLSWLAWACKLPIVLISGFSERWSETSLDTYRVINEDVCHGCFNSERLDAGDWNWCPMHKDTDRMFECTKSIKSDSVINEINQILKLDNVPDNGYTISDETVTIILSHADSEWRKHLLMECIENVEGEIILSSNYPVDSNIQEMCDWVLYTKNNPLLYKEEYDKYSIVHNYFCNDSEGNKIYTPMEYEHGYAAYNLLQNGLKLAKELGKSKIHIVNYDYVINKKIIANNDLKLDEYDCVFYYYDGSDDEESFCSGFLSGRLESLDLFFQKFKSKDEYYTDCKFLQLEKNLRKFYSESESNLFIDKFSVLESSNITNSEGVLMFSKSKNFNRFKFISDKYGCDKTSTHEYHKIYPEILDPIMNEHFSLFEIGIHRGKSVNLWKDYLKNAKIYGMDIGQEWYHDRGRVFRGDQNSIDDLNRIISEINKCKVIVDDGSHKPDHQIKTFYHLFANLLEDGGYYIIEDVETSYWDPNSFIYGYEIGNLNIIDYFTSLNHLVNFKYNGYANPLGIEYIKFASNCIIIKKYNK